MFYITEQNFYPHFFVLNDGEKINYDKLKDIGAEKSDLFADAVAYLIDDSRKIINVENKKFNPNKNITSYKMLNMNHNVLKLYGMDKNLNLNITRTEMAKIIFETFERKNNPGKKNYLDLNKNHWAYKFLMDT